MEVYTFFWGETPPFPPQKKPASAAKPISVCLYKTLTLMLYNVINLPNLMGARRSCGQLIDTSLMTKYSYIEYMVWSRQNKTLQ
jgi:hypothetical protein